MRAKRAKPLKKIIDGLVQERTKKAPKKLEDKPDVDVEAFLKAEREFNKRLKR